MSQIPRRRLTSQELEDMRTYAEMGMSNAWIAKEMKVDLSTVYKRIGARTKHKSAKELIPRMLELQDKGLSHKQIAIELEISRPTVEKYLGTQKTGSRSAYGSLVTHADGESFVPQPLEKKEYNAINELKKQQDKEKGLAMDRIVPRTLKLRKTSVSMDGKEFSYIASSDGRIRITTPTGTTLDIGKESFFVFVSELCELGDWLSKNCLEPEDISQ